MQIPEKLLKPYNPKETEERIYKLWEQYGLFKPETVAEITRLPAGRQELENIKANGAIAIH